MKALAPLYTDKAFFFSHPILSSYTTCLKKVNAIKVTSKNMFSMHYHSFR